MKDLYPQSEPSPGADASGRSTTPTFSAEDSMTFPRVINDDGTYRLEQTEPPNSFLVDGPLTDDYSEGYLGAVREVRALLTGDEA